MAHENAPQQQHVLEEWESMHRLLTHSITHGLGAQGLPTLTISDCFNKARNILHKHVHTTLIYALSLAESILYIRSPPPSPGVVGLVAMLTK